LCGLLICTCLVPSLLCTHPLIAWHPCRILCCLLHQSGTTAGAGWQQCEETGASFFQLLRFRKDE
jgi:hypothetical protein